MKRMSHHVELTINANAADAWAIVGTGEGVDKWLPLITECRVEGSKRYCSTAEGSFEEDILESNDSTMMFRYAIPKQHLMPVENIEGNMQVSAIDDQTSRIRWHWSFDIAESNFEAVKQGLEHIGSAGIRGIEALAQKGQLEQV